MTLTEPRRWVDRAACAGRDDIKWFWSAPPNGARPAGYVSNLAAARACCEACPVSGDCLADALAYEVTTGIWAGTTEPQRRRMAHRPAVVAPGPAVTVQQRVARRLMRAGAYDELTVLARLSPAELAVLERLER